MLKDVQRVASRLKLFEQRESFSDFLGGFQEIEGVKEESLIDS